MFILTQCDSKMLSRIYQPAQVLWEDPLNGVTDRTLVAEPHYCFSASVTAVLIILDPKDMIKT